VPCHSVAVPWGRDGVDREPRFLDRRRNAVVVEAQKGRGGTSLCSGSLRVQRCGLGTTISISLLEPCQGGGTVGVVAARQLGGVG
jgi:hypothetical protein